VVQRRRALKMGDLTAMLSIFYFPLIRLLGFNDIFKNSDVEGRDLVLKVYIIYI
jgi:hypothetical protein